MATKRPYNNSAYGLNEPLINVAQAPIVAKRNPVASDRAEVGTTWVNEVANKSFVLTSVVDNQATWVETDGSAAATTFDGDSGSATPSGGVLNIVGSTGITTSASGNTVSIAVTGAEASSFQADSGTAAPLAGVVILAGAGTVATSATGNTVTFTGSGGGSSNVTLVNTSPYVVQPTDFLLDVDCSGGPITIQLPDTPTAGKAVIVKDFTGNSAFNNITVTTVSGSTLIDGQPSFTININFQSIETIGNSGAAYDIALGYLDPVSLNFNGDSGSTQPNNGNISFFAGVAPTCLGQTCEVRNTATGVFHITANGGGSNTNNIFGTGGNVGAGLNNGNGNTGMGHLNLSNIHNSSNNSAFGVNSQANINSGGSSSSTASQNSSFGFGSLSALVSGAYNCAFGYNSGSAYTTTESSNIVINNAGTVSESNVLRIGAATGTGNQQLNSAFIAGIQTIVVTGTPVLVSTSDQLGVASSSKRFKSDIRDMGNDSGALQKLRPVSFTWDRKSAPGLKDATTQRQYGLIAEEALEHVPHAVNVDPDGQPININYQDLIGMMINEIQKLRKEVDALKKA